MFNLRIDTIPHANQRYDTIGDWYYDERTRVPRIFVSQLGNWKYEFLVALHEMIEWSLCNLASISPEDVDKWDMEHLDSDDPGSIPGCPYFYQHKTALLIERITAHVMHVSWDDYEDAIEKVSATYPVKNGTTENTK